MENHSQCIVEMQEAQESEYDNREMMREADLFLNKRDGQWEPQILQQFNNRPRYTFDECNPIVDDIIGEMAAMEFNIMVSPSGGEASKAIARYYEGIIRNIENISQANHVYNKSARIMTGTGMDAWRIISDFRDDDSFNQDLLIRSIPNVQDSVWFDPNAQNQDMSDASRGWVLSSLTKKAYSEEYPEGSGLSVGIDRRQQAYSHKKPNEIIIGEYLYKKKKYRELALMSDGRVLEVDEDFKKVKDELALLGIEVVKLRKRPYYEVYQKLFDGGDWLSGANETPFCYIPIVPVFGNFRISENKIIYWGITEKLMDAQRVINYSESRKIEEGALAPKGKIWMTKDQAASSSVKRTLSTLNTNNDPVQFYDHVEAQIPPTYIGSPGPNQGLMENSITAQNFIQRTSGTFDEARGTAPPRRSGIAIEKLQTKSDSPKRKWFSAMEVAIGHTCKILIKAIPKVYDTQQTMQLAFPDGTTDQVTIQQKVKDRQTGKVVVLNDLKAGKYNVVCTAGPAFHSRQQETFSALTELAAKDPSILQLGGDVLLNSINAPGIEKIAERKRLMMLVQGLIPPSQMTEEEKITWQQLNKSKSEPSPIEQANLMVAQSQVAETEGKNQERMAKLDIENQKLRQKDMEIQLKAQQGQNKAMIDTMTALSNQIKVQADTLKVIKETMGVEKAVTPTTTQAFKNQAEDLNQTILTQ